MSSRKPPPVPPELTGFTHVELLGRGGFADVFLYEQELPKRRAAVKVLLLDRLGADSLSEFTKEANTMAQLSEHPSIVTIYQAGVSDDHRPYLVMEYCSRPNLESRYRKERFTAVEALRIGVQVAGAVETAHRAGILHRDIKPANILTTQYNRPALTDFGIAAETIAGQASKAEGMSIPWSPSESFERPARNSLPSDVYSLGATIYTLLAGRTPFEVPGESNTQLDLISRIQGGALRPLGRADVPASLERVLATSMARLPEDRYQTALEFGRALQKVEIELGMPVTAIDVLEESGHEVTDDEEDGGRTRIRNIVSIDPEGPSITSVPKAAPAGVPVFSYDAPIEQTVIASRGAVADTQLSAPRQSTMAPPPPPPAVARPSRKALLIPVLVLAGVLLAGGGIAALVLTAPPPETPVTIPEGEAMDPDEGVVPAIPDFVGTEQNGQIVFSWQNPSPQEGDSYLVSVVSLSGESDLQQVTDPTTSVPATGQQVCVDVQLARADGKASAPTRGCSP